MLWVKVLAAAFIMALLFSLLVGTLIVGKVQAATDVSGIISSNTIWTEPNSPYNLTGSVLVDNDVKLTIMPGVTINLNGFTIMVNGTLVAKGTSNNHIKFNGGEIVFTSVSAGWNEETGFGSIISNAFLTSSIKCRNASPMISKCSISCISNPIDVSSGSPIISGNNISAVENIDSSGSLQQTDVGILLSNDNTAVISENVISGPFATACISIYGGSPIIERNVIALGVGIDFSVIAFDYAKPTIQNNTFAYCSEGILTGISTAGLTLTVFYNNFENNTKYNIYWVYPGNLYAAYNWWGTTDAEAINQTIHDFKNDFSSGSVNFVPLLNAPNPKAPSSAPITNPPSITILSPFSLTYSESNVPLLFTLDKPANWMGYSLDGLRNVTLTGNTTITSLSNGDHSIVIYCNNTYGNVGVSETIRFTVNSPIPVILVTAAVVVIVIVGGGLLFYFKKRKR